MSNFPETLGLGQIISRELKEEIERRYNTYVELEQQLANSIVIDMTKAPESSVELVKLLRANAESLLCQQAADEIEGLHTELLRLGKASRGRCADAGILPVRNVAGAA